VCGHTRLDRIGNKVIREKVEVVPIKEKKREARLRRFGYIKRKDINAPRGFTF